MARPDGTPEDVERLVIELMNVLGSEEGGLIMGGEIGPDVPLANAEALLRTICADGSVGLE